MQVTKIKKNEPNSTTWFFHISEKQAHMFLLIIFII